MKLVVIEGIGKLETVQKYLGAGYKVFATGGHVRDLPKNRLAVNIKNNYAPSYTVVDDKKETVERLRAAAKSAETVLLATDPDREGEAISWHVATLLDIPEDAPVRIEFNEISKNAVQKALDNPRAIDKDLVDAQQARRVLDRLVGYKISPVLCKKIQNKLSAGRVQSVTLRLVVDREREIEAFVPEEYWNFRSVLQTGGSERFSAALVGFKGEKLKPSSGEQVDKIKSDLNGAEYRVAQVKKSVTSSHPYAPFITSTMQQDALNKLGMSLKQTSSAAQSLYEGVDLPGEGKVALITYIRTDSTRVSPEAMAAASAFIKENFGEAYAPKKYNFYATKKGAQDAHEAIRPISLDRKPESVKAHLNKYQYQLYNLIYNRFLASQMTDATYNSVAVDITAADYDFRVSGRTPLFDGYTRVYAAVDKQDKDKDDDGATKLPELTEGEALKFVKYDCEQKFTKPPARYTEASLVKAMEEAGIGRPATYSPTVTLLFARKYVEKSGRAIAPTELGKNVSDMLIRYFPDVMDGIEDGGKRWQDVIDEFYDGFEDKIERAVKDDYTLKTPDEETDIVCEKCGGKMMIRTGRYGRFLACANYPKCRNTKNLDAEGNVVEPEPPVESDVKCSKCGATMVVKNGRFGPFLACPNYPKCKNIVSLDGEKSEDKQEELPPCPKCGKPLKRITTRRSTFYGCTGYPECNFTLSSRPTGEKCPECGALLIEKSGKNGAYYRCSDKNCKYKRDMSDDK